MLFTFAALVMCCSAVASLLPAGGIRRTAMLVMGLTILAIGLDALRLEWPDLAPPQLPQSLLVRTEGAGLEAANAALTDPEAR